MLTSPTTSAPSIVPVPVLAPAGSNAINLKPQAAFRLMFHPGAVELFDLSNAPEAALKAAGVDAGRYWLPSPQYVFAQPGVNGVQSDPTWTTAQVLQNGYSEAITGAGRDAGMILLDAWHSIPEAFCPANVPAGPVLRSQSVVWHGQGGTRYLTPWEVARATAPNRPAKIEVDRALMGCWIASLVLQGVIHPAAGAIVSERRQALDARVLKKQMENLPAEQKEYRVETAKAAAAELDAPVLTRDTKRAPKPAKGLQRAAE